VLSEAWQSFVEMGDGLEGSWRVGLGFVAGFWRVRDVRLLLVNAETYRGSMESGRECSVHFGESAKGSGQTVPVCPILSVPVCPVCPLSVIVR
jgi:hypothetical protein